MNNNFKTSVIIPVFNEEGNIEILVKKITDILENHFDYELLFIDDGSTDNTLKIIKKLRKQNNKIYYLSFSRNFGHQNALRAGLDFATGDCVISMDGDLQHPPNIIPKLIGKWQEGNDIVYTIRQDNQRLSFFKRKTANIFYNIMNNFSDVKIKKGIADFRLLDRRVVEIIKTFEESNLFLRGMISWLGFRQYGIEYMPDERYHGKTKYTLKKMMKFAIDGITSFSIKPLRISTIFGYIMAAVAFIYGVYAIIIKLFTDRALSGWASVLVGILFIGGIQMIMIGILGEYIGKLFMESKKRPNYIIKEKNND